MGEPHPGEAVDIDRIVRGIGEIALLGRPEKTERIAVLIQPLPDQAFDQPAHHRMFVEGQPPVCSGPGAFHAHRLEQAAALQIDDLRQFFFAAVKAFFDSLVGFILAGWKAFHRLAIGVEQMDRQHGVEPCGVGFRPRRSPDKDASAG